MEGKLLLSWDTRILWHKQGGDHQFFLCDPDREKFKISYCNHRFWRDAIVKDLAT